MQNHADYLWRCIDSITKQTFKDYEIIITQDGGMAENTNAGIKRARGELIKILFMDDMFAHEDSLKEILANFKGEWLITGCNTNPQPYWTDNIISGNNRLGSPSVLTFKNHFEDNLLFDETMSWVLDCDFYHRMYLKYGEPRILWDNNITIGVHDGQHTNIMTDEEKLLEIDYLMKKYD